jgi:hypothetical protein
MGDEFSVYWWDRDGNQHEEMRFVSAERAVQAANRLCHGPASMMKIVRKVIITDGGDFTNFLWEDGVLKYPTEEMRQRH